MAEYRLNQQGQQVQTAIDKALALGPATSSSAGTMSAADKSKLDSMNPSNYQPVLVSGTNIKTVNNQSILGPGNIDAGSSVTIDSALSSTSTNPVQNKVIYTALSGKQATLVGSGAGQNIKTINNQNILGSGNIDAGSLVTIDSALSTTSTNPVQNKVINTALGGKQDTISDLATIRSGAAAGATAVQPSALSAKQDVLVSGTNIKTVNSQSILGSGNLTVGGSNIDTVTVSVDGTSGNPSGSGSVSGSTLSLSFSGLVGATGATGATGPKGPQGNTGSSVDYPYELVNNLKTDDPEKGLSAAQGVVIDDRLRALDNELNKVNGDVFSPELEIEQGGISLGEETVDNSRIRTKGYILGKTIYVAFSDSGSKAFLCGYKDNGTYISSVNWFSSSQPLTIPGADKYRVVFAYTNNANISPSAFDTLGITISASYGEKYATREIETDLGQLEFQKSYSNGAYPSSVSVGFGATSGQKLIVSASTTGSLGNGWFIDGVKANGLTTNLLSRYSTASGFVVEIEEDYVDIILKIDGRNTGTVNVSVALSNLRNQIVSTIGEMEYVYGVTNDIANLSFSNTYVNGSYPTTPTSLGFGASDGQKLVVNANSTGSLGYGWFITGRKADGTTTTLAQRYTDVTNYEIVTNENYEELFLRIAANNTGTVSISIRIDNWRSSIDEKVSGLSDSIESNNTEAMVALAASRIKTHNYGRLSENSLLSFLITTDVHSDWVRFERAIEFANNPMIDGFICLGDLGDDPDQMRAYDYADAVSRCSKPCLFVPGNHEVVGNSPLTDQEMMQMFYSSELLEKNGDIHPTGKVYWHKDVSKTFNVGGTSVTKTLRIIGMDQYEYCSALERNTAYHTQEQIDWLIGLLDSADEDTYVLILSHGILGNSATVDVVDCSFSVSPEEYSFGQSQDASNNPDFIPRLVNAWINGDKFTASQTMDADDSVISVDHQFASTQRHFVCFLSGHSHFDKVVTSKYAGDLMQIVLTCTSAAEVQQQADLSRGTSGKTQDCVTAITYDWYKDKISLIRFGSDITHDMTERKYINL